MLTRWDPFSELISMREAMNRLFEESFVRPGWLWREAGARAPLPYDLLERPDAVELRVALPGVDPNQLEVTVNQGVLTLKGERRFYTEDEERQYTWHVRGLPTGPFQLAVTLPTDVNAEEAQASYEHGVLTIRLPKAERVRPKRIEIRSGAPHEVIEASAR
jgi:HSP20 family protein